MLGHQSVRSYCLSSPDVFLLYPCLQYCLENMQTLISSKCFRSQLIALLISEFERLLPLYDPGVLTGAPASSRLHGEGGRREEAAQKRAEASLSRRQHEEAHTGKKDATSTASALTALHRVTSEQERAEIRGLLYSGLCRCLVQEDDSNRVAELLTQLLLQPHQTTKDSNREEEGVLMACQIAFDLLQLGTSTAPFLARFSLLHLLSSSRSFSSGGLLCPLPLVSSIRRPACPHRG